MLASVAVWSCPRPLKASGVQVVRSYTRRHAHARVNENSPLKQTLQKQRREERKREERGEGRGRKGKRGIKNIKVTTEVGRVVPRAQ